MTISNNGTGECHTIDSNSNTTMKPNSGGKVADIRLVSNQQETKTVVVEVHRSSADENKPLLPRDASVNSFASLSSNSSGSTSCSLSSAISQELQRRSEVRIILLQICTFLILSSSPNCHPFN